MCHLRHVSYEAIAKVAPSLMQPVNAQQTSRSWAGAPPIRLRALPRSINRRARRARQRARLANGYLSKCRVRRRRTATRRMLTAGLTTLPSIRAHQAGLGIARPSTIRRHLGQAPGYDPARTARSTRRCVAGID